MKDTIGRENRRLSDRNCEACGKLFRPWRSASRFCSRPCLWSTNGGANKKPECWWTNKKGYVEGRIWLPDGSSIRVKKHRFIMQGILGRPLKPWEDVHHKDGVKSNNSPDNLEVISHGKHSTLSNSQRVRRKGVRLRLTPEARKARSLRAIAMQLDKMGRAVLARRRTNGA